MNVHDLGSMTMVREPQGASFSLWQPRNLRGMETMHQPGAACWFELVTNDVDASVQFYGSAFGWKAAVDSHEPAYTNLSRAEAGAEEDWVGGMMKIEPDWGGVLPNWAVYFQVDKVDAAFAQVLELGGEALHDPIDIPNERLITVRDPQGGVFALLESTTEA